MSTRKWRAACAGVTVGPVRGKSSLNWERAPGELLLPLPPPVSRGSSGRKRARAKRSGDERARARARNLRRHPAPMRSHTHSLNRAGDPVRAKQAPAGVWVNTSFQKKVKKKTHYQFDPRVSGSMRRKRMSRAYYVRRFFFGASVRR